MRDQQSSMPSPRVCTSPARTRVANGEAGLASFGFAGCDGDDSGEGMTQFQPVERPHEDGLRRRGAGFPKRMQYRPGLLHAFVTHTGLIANPRSK